MFSKKQGQIGAQMGFRVGRDFEDALKQARYPVRELLRRGSSDANSTGDAHL